MLTLLIPFALSAACFGVHCAQGFECKVIQGAVQLLMSGAVRMIVAELSGRLLNRHNCTTRHLHWLLTHVGFNVIEVKRITQAESLLVARIAG